MPKLKSIIIRYITAAALISTLAMVVVFVLVQRETVHESLMRTAETAFSQIGSILEENHAEIISVNEDYRDLTFKQAELIGEAVINNPPLLNDLNALNNLCSLAGVAEINFFDENGVIISGTVPEYYGMTMDSGEQISFFKPMLEDKSLKLYQDTTPNTALSKPIQYTCVWASDKSLIVQIGVETESVVRLTEKNKLSYIFSLLNTESDVELYAVKLPGGSIVGATNGKGLGGDISELGITLDEAENADGIVQCRVFGVPCHCAFRVFDDDLIIYSAENQALYKQLISSSAYLTVAVAAVTGLLVICVVNFLNKYIVKKLQSVNLTLARISEGQLDERVDINDTVEFNELSRHINSMVRSIVSETEKISYIMDRSDLHIGVYEYNPSTKKVHLTKSVASILCMNQDDVTRLSSDYRLFSEFLGFLRRKPLPEDDTVFKLPGGTERYLKFDEVRRGSGVIGIILDVTQDVLNRRELRSERDYDELTGLLNRRSFLAKLKELFQSPEELGHGAYVLIDAEDLSEVNRQFGHDGGDRYIVKISELVKRLGTRSGLFSRFGGGEFAALIYGYQSDDEVLDAVNSFNKLKEKSLVVLDDGSEKPILCTFGYCFIRGDSGYQQLMRSAEIQVQET